MNNHDEETRAETGAAPRTAPPPACDLLPGWFTGKAVNEPAFCQAFLAGHPLAYVERAFFTPAGRLADENQLRAEIYRMLEPYILTGISKKVDSLISALRIKAQGIELPPQADRIHLANGTLFLDGTFREGQDEIVRSRLPVRYVPDAPPPERWLRFLSELLHPEDIPTLQEYIGYCLIPSNAGQRMLIIKGSGGEGKSQVGSVLLRLFGINAKDGSVSKVSENAFARADLEHILLMIDDDMRLEALKQTNYVKSMVTARGRMDLERKGVQSYQGWMYARIIAFSNGDLTALYDRSDGFFRRQLILTTLPRPADRADDAELADKLCAELEGIFLWAFEGLRRLIRSGYRFTESDLARANLKAAKRDANNIELFMESDGYVVRDRRRSITSKQLVGAYQTWCDENAYPAMKNRTLIEYLILHQGRFGIAYSNSVINPAGRRVRGFVGLGAAIRPLHPMGTWQEVHDDEDPFIT